jgi:hypothetical protein
MTRLKFVSCLFGLSLLTNCSSTLLEDPGNIDSVSFLFQTGARVTTQRVVANNINTVPYFQAASTAIKAAVDVKKLSPEDVKNQIVAAMGDKINDEFYPFFEVGINLIIDTYKRFYEVNNIDGRVDYRVVLVLKSISNGMDEAVNSVLIKGLSIKDALEPNPFKRVSDEDLKL